MRRKVHQWGEIEWYFAEAREIEWCFAEARESCTHIGLEREELQRY
jgi:hypothetical protein